MADLTNEEAHFIAMLRTIKKFDDEQLIAAEDAGTLATYFPHLLELDRDSETAVPLLLEGFVAGYVACRLKNAGLRPENLPASEERQTGVNPVTDEVRVPTN